MEIVLLPENGLKIKGKQATLLVNADDLSIAHHVAVYFRRTPPKKIPEESVVITGPGEYEIGGIKISGIKTKDGPVFSVTVDGVDILLGALSVVEKIQNKLKQHAVVLIHSALEVDATFLNSLSNNVVILYGEKAKEVLQKFAKEGVNETGKYQVTKDKLPQELETVLLK